MNEIDIDDAAPFPVKPFKTKANVQIPRTFIPGWMAKIVYAQYRFHHGQKNPPAPLEYFAQAGGFDAMHVLDFLMGGNGDGKKFYHMLRTGFSEQSVKGEVQIIKPGTKEFYDTMREWQSERDEQHRADNKLTFGYRG